MKSISSTLIPAVLPALALLTLGGCASTSGLATTEPDGIYYSSKDHTTEIVTASASPDYSDRAAADDDPNAVANPEYQDAQTARRGSTSDEYYDEDYAYQARRYYQPSYRGPGVSYYGVATPSSYYWYNPAPAFSPYDMYGYGYGYGAPYNSWAYGPSYYGGFYDPFMPYGSGIYVSVGLGFGSPWGWGGPWYSPYGFNPYGYGYGYGGYGRGFYDGYYAGAYGSGYRGYSYGGFRNGYRSNNSSYVRVAPRRSRGGEATNTGGRAVSGRREVMGNGQRMANGGAAMGTPGAETVTQTNRRSRVTSADMAPAGTEAGSGRVTEGGRIGRVESNPAVSEANEQPGRGRIYRIRDNMTNQPEATDGRGRVVAPAGSQATASPEGYDNRRPRLSTDGGMQTSSPQPQQLPDYAQPRSRRGRMQYSQPQQPQMATQPQAQPQQYQRPARQTRTYEAPPVQQRSYEAPSRSYDGGGSRFGGGNSGGGNSGGGSSRGGGRVR